MEYDLKHLTKKQIQELLNRDQKTVDNWTKLEDDPIPRHHKIGTKMLFVYDWEEVLEWWIRKHTRKVERYIPKSDLDGAKLLSQNIKNEHEQMELDARKETLLEVEDVRKTWSDNLVMIRQSLINVGHTVAGEIIDGMSHNAKKKLIDKRIFAALDTVIKETEENVLS